MENIMSPEVHQVSWELRAYIDRQPEGEVKRIAGNIAANLSTLDKFQDAPAFRAIMAEKLAAWEQAIRANRQCLHPH